MAGRAESAAPGAAEELRLDWDRHDLFVTVTTELERKKRARPRKAEPFTVDWLEAEVGPCDVFYDLGANIGTFSLMAGAAIRAAEGGGSVFAFEPSYSSYSRLSENIARNALEAVVVPVPLLIGGESGLCALAYRDSSPGASRHRLLADGHSALRKRKSMVQRLLMLSLDDLVASARLPEPDLMKIDVDGAELAVLKGASRTLRAPGLRSLIVELDPDLAEPCLALLEAAGLRPVERFSTGHARDVQYVVLERRAQI